MQTPAQRTVSTATDMTSASEMKMKKTSLKNEKASLSVIIVAIILIVVLVLDLLECMSIKEEPEFTGVAARELWVELPRSTPTPTLIEIKRIETEYQPVLITYDEMELISLGKYFITAYCPSECGYNGYNYPTGWTTASDTICHRADYKHRLSEPTTCAISKSLHSFGTEFYIPYFDRTFVAEDTGSAVVGRHLDLFYEDYSSVISFPTGYYEVYKVIWVEKTVAVTEEELELLEKYGMLELLLEKEDIEG